MPASRRSRRARAVRASLVLLVLTAASLLVGLPASEAGPTDGISRVSVGFDGTQGNDDALFQPDITPDGRLVAFTSDASNLVPNDTNGVADVFVKDRVTGIVERVSVHDDGSESTGRSTYASMSADGRFVAFHSYGRLESRDVDDWVDVYVRDRLLRRTVLVSVTVDGEPAAQHGADPHSAEAAITPDGRFVAFSSAAANLVADDTNGVQDVFVRDMVLGLTFRVSVKANGLGDLLDPGQAHGDSFEPAISADGRFVAFHTGANDLVDGDWNNAADVLLHDRLLFTTTLVSRNDFQEQANGHSAHAQMTPDGRLIVYESLAGNLDGAVNGKWNVFLYDTVTQRTERISRDQSSGPPNGHSEFPQITADGTQIVFESTATDLVVNDDNDGTDDVFLYDRRSGVTTKISQGLSATADNGEIPLGFTMINDAGTAIAFHSDLGLVPGDTNGHNDVYVWDLVAVPEFTPPTLPIPTLPTLPPLPPTTIPPLPPNPVDPLIDCADEPFDTTIREAVECTTPLTLP